MGVRVEQGSAGVASKAVDMPPIAGYVCGLIREIRARDNG